jgi:hypothetical protein
LEKAGEPLGRPENVVAPVVQVAAEGDNDWAHAAS